MLLRRIERLKNGKWIEIKMKDLKIGDKFRMFDPLDFKEPVVNTINGTTEWIVNSNPEFHDNVWGVGVEK